MKGINFESHVLQTKKQNHLTVILLFWHPRGDSNLRPTA